MQLYVFFEKNKGERKIYMPGRFVDGYLLTKNVLIKPNFSSLITLSLRSLKSYVSKLSQNV